MPLKMGIARAIITPELGGLFMGYNSKLPSDSVHDDLTVTAVVLESGPCRALLLSVTVCSIYNELSLELRELCGRAADVPASNIIISCVHTHAGPLFMNSGDDGYVDHILIPKCVAASAECVENMAPVQMGVGVSKSLVGINRRQILLDDSVILGQNPWGPYDSEMTVISFKNGDGKNVANIVHCTAHCTATGVVTSVSRDWCGVMIDHMEEETGATTAFFNGCAGDIAPRMTYEAPFRSVKNMMKVGSVAGFDAARTFKDIREYRDADVAVVNGEIRIPYEPIKPLATAMEQYAAIEHSNDGLDESNRKILKQIIEMHEKGETGPCDFVIEQNIIRVGPVVFVPLPFEPFTELSLRLKAYGRFGYTLVCGYSNGRNAYLPTQDQICRGGYEVSRFLWSMPRQLPADTDRQLIAGNLVLMEQFK